MMPSDLQFKREFQRSFSVKSRFDGVPLDADTKIIIQCETVVGSYPALYQKWRWEGITAESLIFANDDIDHVEVGEIEVAVRAFPGVNSRSKMTVKRSDSGYTFFNFNFDAD